MALSDALLEEVGRHMADWLANYENAHRAELRLVSLDLERGKVEEELQTALDEQSKAEGAVKGLLAEVDETPENMAQVESVLSPFLARAEFLQVVS